MKLKCVQASFEERVSMFNKNTQTVWIKGLTKDKAYEGSPVSLVSGDGNLGFGTISTDLKFLIFNDDFKWETYEKELFEPYES